MNISIVTTAFNEEECIDNFIEEVSQTVSKITNNYEIILVDNGSVDRTLEIILAKAKKNKKIKVVSLSRNFGYQGGIDAGISHASGEWTIIIDTDLQDPPTLILPMLEKAKNENLEIVYGIRKSREETIFRKIAYWLFYRLWKKIANIPVVVDAGDFCLISSKAKNEIVNMPERGRFLRGQRLWIGFKHGGIKYHRKNREMGSTKFNIYSSIQLAIDGLFSFSFFPIRLVLVTGIFLFCILTLIILVFIIGRILFLIFGSSSIFPVLPDGLTIIQILLAAFFSLNFIFLGVIGEYLARVYEEVRQRPRYIVNLKKNF